MPIFVRDAGDRCVRMDQVEQAMGARWRQQQAAADRVDAVDGCGS